ncbi:MerR family transcriptional regulator [Elizabethkingia meningoseptica]|uniref:chaperone modulator CbpM n=1 Tax=Elizabethkingia meningoseptica TaxID=238 RepID=UPI0009999DFC|nr:chaperone modulator CbpM [Elizabethkingia meningoseptica]OPB96926.1 MerR family transcriptional regulator [Elizabethkingia meningoseptica]
MEERISREELIRLYNIEMSFLESLEDSGLLHIQRENEVKYVLYSDLPALERFTNWHYDLEVNMPGIEIISNLLQKIEALQEEKRKMIEHFHFKGTIWEDAEL